MQAMPFLRRDLSSLHSDVATNYRSYKWRVVLDQGLTRMANLSRDLCYLEVGDAAIGPVLYVVRVGSTAAEFASSEEVEALLPWRAGRARHTQLTHQPTPHYMTS